MNYIDNRMLLEIQTGLEQLWPLIDFYLSQSGLSDYSAPVLEASMSVERMIGLIAYERGFIVDNGTILCRETKEPVDSKIHSLFALLRSGGLADIPNEVKEYIAIIQANRNRAAHVVGTSYSETVIFAEAFDCFTAWFIVNSYTLQDLHKTDVASYSKFINRIGNLSSRLKVKIISKDSGTNDRVISSFIPSAKQAIESGSDLNAFTQELRGTMRQCLVSLAEIRTGVVSIEKKVDQIAESLEKLTKQVESFQSLLSRQVSMAITDDEIDRIIGAYTDECISRITREVNSSIATQAFSSEREKLVLSMGETAWNKLDPSSQNFLITAKVTYSNLILMHDVIDFSGVCLLVTKAIEVEMNNRFCRDFLQYLKEKYPGKNNYSSFPTTLLNKFGKPLRTKDFTLGSVAYVLGYSTADGVTPEQAEKDYSILVAFVSERLMSGRDESSIKSNLEMIAEGVENIRKDYRNPSAHTNQLRYVDAKQCFDLVLDVEKLLKKLLDVLDY